MPNFHPMPRKLVRKRKSSIMKKSWKELQTTRAHMQRATPRMSDVRYNVNDIGSRPTKLYSSEDRGVPYSKVRKIKGFVPSRSQIEDSRVVDHQFKAMVHKENNVNGVHNYKAYPSRVMEGSNASPHVKVVIEERVKKLDCTNGKEFAPHIFGKDLSNNQKETNFVVGNTEHVPNCNTKKRQRGSLFDGKPKTIVVGHSEGGEQVNNGNCTQMKKCRFHKVRFECDNGEVNNCFGYQNLMSINDDKRWVPKSKDTSANYGATMSTHIEKQTYCCSKPIDKPTWRGIFKIGPKYVSLAGHLSTKYREKVWKLSRSLLPVVELKKLARSKAWPKGWEASKPNSDNIGLYFFSHEMRPNEELDQLLKEVIEKDLALQAIVGEAEMLIFPSILLPEQYKKFKAKHYLWGVFKPREHKGDVFGSCAQVEGKTRNLSIHQDEGKYGEVETIFMKSATPLENQNLQCKNIYEAQATSVQAKKNIGFELKTLEEERRGDALGGVVRAGEAMENATSGNIHASHAQIEPTRGLPSGRVFGFVVTQTPRLLELIQEMECEGGVVIAMQGEMIGAGTWQRNNRTFVQ